MGRIIQNDRLKNKFGIIGYKKGNEIIDVNSDLINISKILCDFTYNIDNRRHFVTKGKLIKEARQLLDNFFDLHEVNFLPQKVAENMNFALEMGLLEDRDFLKKVGEVSVKKSPYDIPIEFSGESITHEKLLNDSVYFYSINIDKRTTKMSVPIYIHELGHTQLDSQRGVVIDYHNREVISIFLEQLSALMMDKSGKLLRNVELYRYQDLLRCIKVLIGNIKDDLYKLEACVFVVSTLKSDCLFDKYMSSDNKIKEEILWGIQKIFDGKETVEDLLDRYNISFEYSNSSMLIKRRLRK